MSAWEPDDLARRLQRVLDVAERTIRVLVGWPFETGDEEGQPEKAMAETAFLLLVGSRIDEAYTVIHTRVDELARLLAPFARSPTILAGMSLMPALAHEYAAAHVCLTRLGYPDARFDRALAASIASSAAGMRERTPYRQLELEWLNDLDSRRGDLPRDPTLAARSAVGIGLDAFASDRMDMYAFSHSLAYLSDFGNRRDGLPRVQDAVAGDAEAAVARCLDADDFDLAGELLLTWPYLGRRWSPAGGFAFQVLARVEDEVGYLPSLGLSKQRYDELEGSTRTRYTVGEAYHTVYVMGLLCAAILRAGIMPPRAPEPVPHAVASQALLSLLPTKDPVPQWETDFGRLTLPERGSLASFVATVALDRAISQFDLERAHAILKTCLEHRVGSPSAMRQAAELLRRFALLGNVEEETTISFAPADPGQGWY